VCVCVCVCVCVYVRVCVQRHCNYRREAGPEDIEELGPCHLLVLDLVTKFTQYVRSHLDTLLMHLHTQKHALSKREFNKQL
jgi:hypothetical protein